MNTDKLVTYSIIRKLANIASSCIAEELDCTLESETEVSIYNVPVKRDKVIEAKKKFESITDCNSIEEVKTLCVGYTVPMELIWANPIFRELQLQINKL